MTGRSFYFLSSRASGPDEFTPLPYRLPSGAFSGRSGASISATVSGP